MRKGSIRKRLTENSTRVDIRAQSYGNLQGDDREKPPETCLYCGVPEHEGAFMSFWTATKRRVRHSLDWSVPATSKLPAAQLEALLIHGKAVCFLPLSPTLR